MAIKRSQGAVQNDELLNSIRAVCLRHGCPEPNEFLAAVMSGIDPRYDVSALYQIVSDIDKGGKLPTAEQWETLRDMVLLDPAFRPPRVDLTASFEAAKKLVDARYPKLKTIELDGAVEIQQAAPALTIEEIEAFLAVDDSDL